MRNALKIVVVLLVMGITLYMGSVCKDKAQLKDAVLRLHVVANSDSCADQEVKLKVRDAVLASVEDMTSSEKSKEEVEDCLKGRLTALEEIANRVLDSEGMTERAHVTLAQEEFPIREYDTFTLPAGVYDSLRITIGSGEGHNWWCVVFPSLCIPAASDTIEDTAVAAGFSDSLTGAITEQKGYEVRFFLLDVLGELENFFHKG